MHCLSLQANDACLIQLILKKDSKKLLTGGGGHHHGIQRGYSEQIQGC